jgi:glutamate synthase domain-containing protein 2/glutamate synthase domain-containing protein 1/glutamate synthase domain-containing protein 3
MVARLGEGGDSETVGRALEVLGRLAHRGAEGADVDTGDGAGILLQIPDGLLRATVDFALPAAGQYGVAVCFVPEDAAWDGTVQAEVAPLVEARGLRVLGWREVAVDRRHVGRVAAACAPVVRQLFVGVGGAEKAAGIAEAGVFEAEWFERRLYLLGRLLSQLLGGRLEVISCSSRTLVYKGMLTAAQLGDYYPELRDPRCASRLALVHARFSTNTAPSWALAQPYHLLCHNGEVNTLDGNRNWMRARQSRLGSPVFGEDLVGLPPVLGEDLSDSASLDAVLELMVRGGWSLPRAVMTLLPQAYERRVGVSRRLREFFTWAEGLMEPWDGPALVAFSDGRVCGASLDRNGLRPARWAVTGDGWLVLASEAGTLGEDSARIVEKGRLEPGKLLIVDVTTGRVSTDGQAESEIAAEAPYGQWVAARDLPLAELSAAEPAPPGDEPLESRQRAFGYTQEDLTDLVGPLVSGAKEPTGSMGDDTPLAVLSARSRPLFDYFAQRFAQVTNPAIDPIRESMVMSLRARLGPRQDLLDPLPEGARQLVLEDPLLREENLAAICAWTGPDGRSLSHILDATWPAVAGPTGMTEALEGLRVRAAEAVRAGARVLVISDRAVAVERAPVPALLATATVHQYLVEQGIRLRAGIAVESGEVREVHHLACLIGYGASAVNPYLLFASAAELACRGEIDVPVEEVVPRMLTGLRVGLLKVLSRRGISTIASYTGAQIFEAVGLDPGLVRRHFGDTPNRIGGVGERELAQEVLARHAAAFAGDEGLPVGGRYRWAREGERHLWNPETIPALQRAVGLSSTGQTSTEQRQQDYQTFAAAAHADNRRATLRGQLRLREAATALPVHEVEPATEIVRRFATGAMSLGSLSPEAHETLAVAMNRIGGRSNTGEGGEDPRRYTGPDPRARSAIKQVASARFGVTSGYLVNADELQIKIAQGSKPGEGGQLPGHKVTDYIAALRYSTPGVELISPPPHHDIYSIEDLKQLIFDLRCGNDTARVSVKLVAQVGVGTVAAGCVKANADRITIAGAEGGTGASPLSSIKHAGVPWELGLAETQQVLVESGLRSRVSVDVDGQLKTGRDVVLAGLLGADEMTFSTAPLIATGCVMMRVCHLNTCPVGIATQDEQLRERFAGTPEHVVAYFLTVAEQARELMARLGIARFDDLIGRTDLLEPDPERTGRAKLLQLHDLLALPEAAPEDRRHSRRQRRVFSDADHELVRAARPALERGEPVRLRRPVDNSQRTVGGLLSAAISRRHGEAGLAPGTIRVRFDGSAGQSFGAWLAPGVELTLHGEANDYVGKGLSGGVLAVRPPADAGFGPDPTVIAGNTVLYGATSGRAFFAGTAGERFAVRNSGALAVVEGIGDHGCEYMTGGRIVVLGPTGQNFAAGMSGGIAYVLDNDGDFATRCNPDLVELGRIQDPAEADDVHDLLAEHRDRTGSPQARRLIEDWDATLTRLVRVMPTDYKHALRAQHTDDPTTTGPEPAPSAEPAAGHRKGA